MGRRSGQAIGDRLLAAAVVGFALSLVLRLAGAAAAQPVDILLGAVLLVVLAIRTTGHTTERRPWRAVAGAVGLSVLGGAVAGFARAGNGGMLPIPSEADAFWLLRYPLLVYAVLALVALRARTPSGRLPGLDAVIGAGAVAALGGIFVASPILHADLPLDDRLFRLMYPIGDLLVVGSLVGAVALSGWRVVGWGRLAAGLLLFAAAESMDSLSALSATGNGTGSGASDPLYLGAAILLCVAAGERRRMTDAPELPVAPRGASGRAIALPAGLVAIALATLAEQCLGRPNPVTLVCAFASLAASCARQSTLLAEHGRMLATSHAEARTDQLTGLRNRRALMEDLPDPAAGDASALAVFDLNGFKSYNDRFGHQAGDALLARMAAAIARAAGDGCRAYRMGGDEFCVVIDDVTLDAAATVAAIQAAVRSSGRGFSISVAAGFVTLPGEAATADAALRLADDRMYSDKATGGGSARQPEVPLLALLRERDPGLGDHTHDVAEMCAATAAELGCDATAVALARRGGELHDVGKMAIPDAILHKPGPLTEEEWVFMRRHTVIGDRILSSSPGLAEVAPIARHHHERFDGGGYPDGLAGRDIPLLARVVTVCDAFEAIVADRPYRAGRSVAEARAELRACAGVQFDPAVVAAFERAVLGALPLSRAA
jgi:two-component system, cell cycle response regulator